jgi:hypothetical protein
MLAGGFQFLSFFYCTSQINFNFLHPLGACEMKRYFLFYCTVLPPCLLNYADLALQILMKLTSIQEINLILYIGQYTFLVYIDKNMQLLEKFYFHTRP